MKTTLALAAILFIASPSYATTSQIFQINDTSSAVNNVQVTGAATGTAPSITSSGADTNVGLILNTQGTGTLSLETASSGNINLVPGSGGEVIIGSTLALPSMSTPTFEVINSASAVNGIQFLPATTGNTPVFSAVGTDVNVGLILSTQGTGALNLETAGSGNVILAPGSGSVTIPAFTTAGIVQNSASGVLFSTTTLPNGTTATTQSAMDNSTKVATTAYVDSAVSGVGTGIKSIAVQIFSSSGTYTPNANLVYAIVKMVGGGGGSGAVSSGGGSGAGGGGSGAYIEALLTAAQVGSSQTVTIGSAGSAGTSGGAGGNGGTTSVGSLLSCAAGNGGSGGSTSSAGGTGGAPTITTGTEILKITGQKGGYGGVDFLTFGGQGGSNPLGFGGASTAGPGANSISVAATSGTGYGAGAGGPCNGNGGSAKSGAAGQAGYVEIVEYNSQ